MAGKQANEALLGTLALALATLLIYSGQAPQMSALLPLLAAACLTLELTAVRLPVGGILSSAGAVYLAAAALPTVGARSATLFALFALMARFWTGGRLLEMLLDLCAALTGICAVHLLSGGLSPGPAATELSLVAVCGGACAYLAVWALLPEVFLPSRSQDEKLLRRRLDTELRMVKAGMAAASLLLAGAATAAPWYLLPAIPLLWIAQRGAENQIYRLQSREASGAIDKLQRSRKDLKKAQTTVHKTRLELEEAEEQKNLLEGFAQHLASDPGPEEVFQAIAATVRLLAPYRSLVIFLQQEDGSELWPSRFVSPESDRLQDARLLQLKEPIVEKARQSGRTVKRQLPDEIPLLQSERIAVALPLRGEGVLYLGRNGSTGFTQNQVARLEWIADKAALAIASARRTQAREFELALQSRARFQLQNRVELLATLNLGSRELASTLELERLLEILKTFLLGSVPHGFGAVLTLGREPYCWDSQATAHSLAPSPELDELLAAVQQQTLFLPDLQADGCRFDSPVPGGRCLLCAPMRSADSLLGHILLLTNKPNSFTDEHRDLLATIANQAGVAVRNIEQHLQVVEARRLLEESQAQLIQASKMTAVGQLAAGVAHELNTPLGVIGVSLEAIEMALNKNKPERAQKKLPRAKKAVETSKHIIRKLLFYSRRESKESQTIDLNAILKETIDFVGHYLDNSSFSVTQELADLPPVEGKPKELQQVLVNLVMNAVDASGHLPDEERRVHLRTYTEPGYVVVAVQDWGRGMKPEVLERVFDPFFTTKDVGEGTGLGLSVSHQIVAQHNGSLQAESVLGEGSTFYLRLPLS